MARRMLIWGRATEPIETMSFLCNIRTPVALTVGAADLRRIVGGWVAKLAHDKRGQDQVEYGVFIGLMALAAALSLTELSDAISNAYSQIGDALDQAGNCANPNPG